MIRALLLIMLLATPAHAIIIVGVGGSGGGGGVDECTTQAIDVEHTTTNTSSQFDTTEERGQSWKASSGANGKKLYSVQFRRATTDFTTATLTYRIGTSSNLSSTYLVAETCSVPDATGYFECVIPQDERPTLTGGTTYYLLMRTDALFYISRDTSSGGNGTYADGTAFYDTGRNWTGTTSVADLPFKTKYCE